MSLRCNSTLSSISQFLQNNRYFLVRNEPLMQFDAFDN